MARFMKEEEDREEEEQEQEEFDEEEEGEEEEDEENEKAGPTMRDLMSGKYVRRFSMHF